MSDESASVDTSAMSSDTAAAERAAAQDERKQMADAIVANAARAMSGQAVASSAARAIAMDPQRCAECNYVGGNHAKLCATAAIAHVRSGGHVIDGTGHRLDVREGDVNDVVGSILRGARQPIALVYEAAEYTAIPAPRQAADAVAERVAAMHDTAAAGVMALTRTLATMQDQLNSMGLMLAQNRNALLVKREELAAHEANYTDWEKRVVGEMRTLQNEITNLKARSEGNG